MKKRDFRAENRACFIFSTIFSTEERVDTHLTPEHDWQVKMSKCQDVKTKYECQFCTLYNKIYIFYIIVAYFDIQNWFWLNDWWLKMTADKTHWGRETPYNFLIVLNKICSIFSTKIAFVRPKRPKIWRRRENCLILHCQSDGAARHHLPIGTRQDAHRLGTSSGRARRIVRSGSARETNVRNTRSTLVALHL